MELPLHQGFPATALLMFGSLGLYPGGRLTHCGVCSSIPASTPTRCQQHPPEVVLPSMSPDIVNAPCRSRIHPTAPPQAKTDALQGWGTGHQLSKVPGTELGTETLSLGVHC